MASVGRGFWRALIVLMALPLGCAKHESKTEWKGGPVVGTASHGGTGASAAERAGAAAEVASGGRSSAMGPAVRTGVKVGSAPTGPSEPGAGPRADGGTPTEGDPSLPPVVPLAVGELDTCVVLSDGRLKCWGAGSYGQLGLGDSDARGDEPREMGADLPAVDLGSDLRARAVAAGKWNTCALLENRRIKCWGLDAGGPVGLGTIAIGSSPGQMGDALPFIPLPPDAEPLALAVSEDRSCALLRDGRLSCWGGASGAGEGKTRELNFGRGRAVRAISLHSNHSCALFEDGSVRCWGANHWGQLGIGSTEDLLAWSADTPAVDLGRDARAIAVVAAPLHSCALLEDGTVKCWGHNRYGQLGQGDIDARGDEPRELGDFLPAIELGTGRHAVAIGAGEINTCALLDDGSVKCWGGESVQLGLGELVHGDEPFEMGDALPAIDLGPGERATRLSVGAAHACAVLEDGDLKCWGMNVLGALGLGDEETRGDDSWEMGSVLPAVDFGGELLED